MKHHFYKIDGREWGPFTGEERADLEATARRPIEWRTEEVPDSNDDCSRFTGR